MKELVNSFLEGKLKREVVLKRAVFVIFVCFCLGNSAITYFIFKKSINMDQQHLKAVYMAVEIDKEILKTRVLIDDLKYLKNNELKKDLNKNLESIKKDLDKLKNIFAEEFEKANNDDLVEFEKEYKLIINNFCAFKKFIDTTKMFSDNSNTKLLVLYNQLSVENNKFTYFLQRYLYDNTVMYKRQVWALFIVILAFIFLSGYFVVYLIKQLSNAERKHIQTTIEVENRERQRIAADLHDGLGAYLSSLIMSIELLAKENENNNELLSKLGHLNQLSRHSLESVEEVINNLNPSLLIRVGLFKALEKAINKINALDKTQFLIDSVNLNLQLSQSMEIMLYRICMELINNALKHSNAETARFTFQNTKNRVNILYEDNGVGFINDETKFESNKTGLYNLANRIESVGGTYFIDSQINNGVKINMAFKV